MMSKLCITRLQINIVRFCLLFASAKFNRGSAKACFNFKITKMGLGDGVVMAAIFLSVTTLSSHATLLNEVSDINSELSIESITHVGCSETSLLFYLCQVDHTKSDGTERTLVLLKPDAVVRGHVGVTIASFEKCGLNVENLRVFDKVPQTTLSEHYKEHAGKGFYDELLQYMSSGPVVAIQVPTLLRWLYVSTNFFLIP